MKTVIYALGGGLGHISRAYKLSQFLQLHNLKNQVFIIASQQKIPFFFLDKLNFVLINSNQIANISSMIFSIIQNIKPDLWITDVFPNGLFHELPLILNKFHFKKVVTVRILKEEFCRIYSEILYDESWQVEWLPDYMNSFVEQLAIQNQCIRLPILIHQYKKVENKNWILHTGSYEEVKKLKMQHQDFEMISYLDNFPLPYFKNCRLVTAAGCNILQDLNYLENCHYIYPQNRKFDDQSLRAQNYHMLKKWFLNA